MNKKPVIISRKEVFKANYFSLDEIVVEYPNNKKKKYGAIQRSSSVYVLPMTNKHDLYLISQYRFLLERTRLEVIAGFVDEGEKPLETAKRELQEEAGIVAEKWTLLGKTEMSGSIICSNVYIYLAQDLEIGTASPEDDEDILLVKMPLGNAVDKAINNEISDLGSKLGILMVNHLQLQNKI